MDLYDRLLAEKAAEARAFWAAEGSWQPMPYYIGYERPDDAEIRLMQHSQELARRGH